MTLLADLQAICPTTRLELEGVPSASIAILEDGKTSATVISNGSEDTSTLYQACSISKAITALAVAKLVDNGHFTYDTSITKHLPQDVINSFVEPETAHLAVHVTVRMLLSHTSGLTQHGFPGYARADKLPTVQDSIAGRPPSNTPRIRFATFPGAQFSYSGGGFILLQLFLEIIMDVPFAELMQRKVLHPLGMTRSHFGDLSIHERDYATAHCTAHVEANAKYHRLPELAAAGLWSTPTDLLKAILAIQESLHTASGFITQATAREMLTPIIKCPETSGIGALGWGSDALTFGHTGSNNPGYECYAFGFHGGAIGIDGAVEAPHLARSGVAVMTNAVGGFSTVVRKVISAVFYLEGWPRFRSLACRFGKDDYVAFALPESLQRDAKDAVWRQWVGRWKPSACATGSSDIWKLDISESGKPLLSFSKFPPMSPRPAAAPANRGEYAFVVDGLDVMIRLVVSEKGENVVECLQGDVSVTTLEKLA